MPRKPTKKTAAKKPRNPSKRKGTMRSAGPGFAIASLTGRRSSGSLMALNRQEQVKAFRHWVFVAIRAIATKVAQHAPQTVEVIPASESLATKRYLSKASRRKAMTLISDTDELEPLPNNHPLNRLLMNPNEPDTYWDFVYELVMYLYLTGEGYIWCLDNALRLPAQMHVVPSHWMFPRVDRDNFISHYSVRPFQGSGSFDVSAGEVIKIKWKSPLSKIDGWSPLRSGAEWIDSSEAIDSARWSSFHNGAEPRLLIELGPELAATKEKIDEFKAALEAKYRGIGHTGETLVVPSGVKATQLGIAPREMEFPTTANQMRDWVLSLFGVSKVIAGIVEDYNRSNMEAAIAGFCEFTVNPLLNMVGATLTEKLATRFDISRRLKIFWDDCSPEDQAFKLTKHQAMVSLGAMSRNEWRADEGLEPVEGGDELLVAMGQVPLSEYAGGGFDFPIELPEQQALSKEADVPEADCGGPGSGVPGPCPGSGSAGSAALQTRSDSAAKSWADKAKDLPAAIASKAKNYATGKYNSLKDRYGKGMAIAIMGAGVAGLPLPVPGSMLITAAPVIAVAEIYRRFRGAKMILADRFKDLLKADDDLSDEEIQKLGKEWIEDLLAGWEPGDAERNGKHVEASAW